MGGSIIWANNIASVWPEFFNYLLLLSFYLIFRDAVADVKLYILERVGVLSFIFIHLLLFLPVLDILNIPLSNKNNVALSIVVACALVNGSDHLRNWLKYSIILISLLSCVFLNSVFCFFLVILVSLWNKRNYLIKYKGTIILLVLLLSASCVTFLTFPERLLSRLDAIDRSLFFFHKHPILGIGLGNSDFVIPYYNFSFFGSEIPSSARHTLIHNLPVKLLAEMGLIAFFFLAYLCFSCVKNYKTLSERYKGSVALIIVLLLSMCVYRCAYFNGEFFSPFPYILVCVLMAKSTGSLPLFRFNRLWILPFVLSSVSWTVYHSVKYRDYISISNSAIDNPKLTIVELGSIINDKWFNNVKFKKLYKDMYDLGVATNNGTIARNSLLHLTSTEPFNPNYINLMHTYTYRYNLTYSAPLSENSATQNVAIRLLEGEFYFDNKRYIESIYKVKGIRGEPYIYKAQLIKLLSLNTETLGSIFTLSKSQLNYLLDQNYDSNVNNLKSKLYKLDYVAHKESILYDYSEWVSIIRFIQSEYRRKNTITNNVLNDAQKSEWNLFLK